MIPMDEILKLSPEEKILLLEKVWDSISPEDIPVPESHVNESRRRIQSIRSGTVSLSSWKEVRKRLREQL